MPPKCELWLNNQEISEANHHTDKNMLKVHFGRTLQAPGVCTCILSTADEPIVSTTVVVNFESGKLACWHITHALV